ncbi:MAG: DUF535 family protein [Verrucomicrobiia bacterium]
MAHLIKMLADTAPLIHRAPTTAGVLKRIKYCLRGLVYPHYTKEWFELLETPELAIVVKNHPYLFHKLQRPYLNRSLNTHQRLEALKQHYGFVVAHFSPSMMLDIYATPGLLLATMPLAEIGHFGLRLGCSRKEKEGDLSIGLLEQKSSEDLFTLSFSFSRSETNRREIFVGGLQGHTLAGKDLVVSITRHMHGLRPKALLIFALQQLAAGWGITNLRAVSDDQHIYRHFQKRREFSASYDEFWVQCGGRRAEDGMFNLPVTFVPREISTIKANKRQMYRRRYAMLSNIAGQIRFQMSLPADWHPAFVSSEVPAMAVCR